MILKARQTNSQLAYLHALKNRTILSQKQLELYETLKENDALEVAFETYISLLDQSKFDLIWQFVYSDYHTDATINLILVSDNAIYLFKLNNYGGLHYVNNEGILTHYITEQPKLDILQLNCVKYSIYTILDDKFKHLPIYIKCVCMNETFDLDTTSDHYPFLFKSDIIPYINKINHLNKKKVPSKLSTS